MPIFITFFVTLILVFLIFKNWVFAVELSIILGITYPLTNIGGFSLSFDFIVLLLLFVVYLKIPHKRNNSFNGLFLIFFFILICSTLFSSAIISSIRFELVSLIGIFRFILIYILITKLPLPPKNYEKALLVALIINIVVVALQILTPNAAEWTYNLYSKGEGSALEAGFLSGRMSRPVGTLGNSAPFGFFVCIGALVGFKLYYKYRNYWILACVILAAVTGLFSTSKVFILLFPVLLILFMFFGGYILNLKSRNGTVITTIVILAFFSILGFYIVKTYLINDIFSAQFEHVFMSFVEEGVSSTFETRYSDGGAVMGMIDIFYKYPVLGVGVNSVEGEFMGDSSMVLVLHHTGIVGFIFILWLYLKSLFISIKKRNKYATILVLMLFATGFVTNMLFSFPAIVYFAYLYSLVKYDSI